MADAGDDSQQRIVINFIDPLFSVVLSASFGQIYLDYWFKDFSNIWNEQTLFLVLTLMLGYLTVILSWVGYHQSIKSTPIKIETAAGRWRFGLDVVLLISYFVLLVSYGNFRRVLGIIVVIYLLFFLWDQMKRHELLDSHRRELVDSARRRGVTVFWLIVFLAITILYIVVAYRPSAPHDCRDWAFLVAAMASTILYRFHKKHLWYKPCLDILGFPNSEQYPRMRIYIAGPYTAATPDALEANAKNAIDAGLTVLQKGHVPFIPHLTHYVDLRAKEIKIEIGWNDYMKWDDAWLEQCDALLYLSSSKGADIERKRAESLGKIIFISLHDVPNAS